VTAKFLVPEGFVKLVTKDWQRGKGIHRLPVGCESISIVWQSRGRCLVWPERDRAWLGNALTLRPLLHSLTQCADWREVLTSWESGERHEF
jgi:hypothetical protein